MAKKKAVKKVVEQPVEEVKEEIVEEVVSVPEARASLNATSAQQPPEVVVKEDSSKVDKDAIMSVVDDIISTHFKSDKKLGTKVIVNQLRKLLN